MSMTAEERAEKMLRSLFGEGPVDVDFVAVAAIRAAEREALERAANAVCRYAGRCNSDRCPCRAIRALIPAGEETGHE